MIQGPNVKRLICERVTLLAVPAGGGLKSAIEFLTTPGELSKRTKEATQWVEAALLAIRNASEPNPYKHQSDEELAGEILKGIEAKRKENRNVYVR